MAQWVKAFATQSDGLSLINVGEGSNGKRMGRGVPTKKESQRGHVDIGLENGKGNV